MASLATVLGIFKLYRMPWGGSVSLKLLPLLYLALRRGPKAGAAGGQITGITTFILEPPIIFPLALVLFDYILPYLSIGLAGWFRNSPRWGICLSIIVGLVFHVISGVLYFAAFAPPDLNRQTYQILNEYIGLSLPSLLHDSITPWLYSVLYNSSYIIPELILMLFLVPYVIKRLDRHRSV